MSFNRRDFIRASGAMSAVLFTGLANAASNNQSGAVENPVVSAAQVEKSIKASFGSGFSVRTQTQQAGSTVAGIEHAGNHYIVASSDLVDWNILSSDIV